MTGFEPASTRFAVWRLKPLGHMCTMDATGFGPVTGDADQVSCPRALPDSATHPKVRTTGFEPANHGVKVRCLKPLGHVPV